MTAVRTPEANMVRTPTDYIPAFPSQQYETLDGSWNQTYDPGMSLRDYFAGQALVGLCAHPQCGTIGNRSASDRQRTAILCEEAYAVADAMLVERAK